jgi:molecular chaperone DnaK (HSP70)
MIVGIDLGTTFSLISYVNSAGTPTLIPSRRDPQRFQTPSVVHIGERGAIVGDLAEELLQEEPSLPVSRFAKRHGCALPFLDSPAAELTAAFHVSGGLVLDPAGCAANFSGKSHPKRG